MTDARDTSTGPGFSRSPNGIASLICTSLLLGTYLFLSSEWGGRWFDRHSLGSYGSGVVSFGLLVLWGLSIMLIGLVTGVRGWLRRERPRWLTGSALLLNAVVVLWAIGRML